MNGFIKNFQVLSTRHGHFGPSSKTGTVILTIDVDDIKTTIAELQEVEKKNIEMTITEAE